MTLCVFLTVWNYLHREKDINEEKRDGDEREREREREKERKRKKERARVIKRRWEGKRVTGAIAKGRWERGGGERERERERERKDNKIIKEICTISQV